MDGIQMKHINFNLLLAIAFLIGFNACTRTCRSSNIDLSFCDRRSLLLSGEAIDELKLEIERGESNPCWRLAQHYDASNEPTEAIRWIKQAADMGDERAQTEYGNRMLVSEETRAKGIKVLEAYAVNGNPYAAGALVSTFESLKDGKPRDAEKARFWAAEERRLWQLRGGKPQEEIPGVLSNLGN